MSICLVVLYWLESPASFHQYMTPLVMLSFSVINIHLRLRFVIATGVSSIVLAGVFLNVIFEQSFTRLQYCLLAYCIVMAIFTLAQVYLKELKLRKDFKHLQILKSGSHKSRALIENMVPMSTHAKHLLNGELVFDELHDVTLLYSDLRGFTPLSAKMTPQALCKLLNLIYSAFDRHLEHFGLYKIGKFVYRLNIFLF